jgi:hypothetical protein
MKGIVYCRISEYNCDSFLSPIVWIMGIFFLQLDRSRIVLLLN